MDSDKNSSISSIEVTENDQLPSALTEPKKREQIVMKSEGNIHEQNRGESQKVDHKQQPKRSSSYQKLKTSKSLNSFKIFSSYGKKPSVPSSLRSSMTSSMITSSKNPSPTNDKSIPLPDSTSQDILIKTNNTLDKKEQSLDYVNHNAQVIVAQLENVSFHEDTERNSQHHSSLHQSKNSFVQQENNQLLQEKTLSTQSISIPSIQNHHHQRGKEDQAHSEFSLASNFNQNLTNQSIHELTDGIELTKSSEKELNSFKGDQAEKLNNNNNHKHVSSSKEELLYLNPHQKSQHSLTSLMKSADQEPSPQPSIDLDDTEAAYFSSQGILAGNVSHMPNLTTTLSLEKLKGITSQVVSNLKVVEMNSLPPVTAPMEPFHAQYMENDRKYSNGSSVFETNPAKHIKVDKDNQSNHRDAAVQQKNSTVVPLEQTIIFNHSQQTDKVDRSSSLHDPKLNSDSLGNMNLNKTSDQPKDSETAIVVSGVASFPIAPNQYKDLEIKNSAPYLDIKHSQHDIESFQSRLSTTGNNMPQQANTNSNYENYAHYNSPQQHYPQKLGLNRASTTSRKRNCPSNTNLKRKPVLERFFDQRQLLFIDEEDVYVFDEINEWKENKQDERTNHNSSNKAENSMRSYQEACELFEEKLRDRPLTQTIIKLLFHIPVYHYILRYNKTDGYQDIRELFEYEMLREGLFLEKEVSIEDTSQVFLKIYGSFALHCRIAEKIKLKKQLKAAVFPVPKDELDRKHSYLMRMLVEFLEEGLDLNRQYAPFWKDYLEKFADCPSENQSFYLLQDQFFSEREQLLLIYKVIDSIEMFIDTKIESKRIGLYHLLHRQIYSSLYCLHHHPRDQDLEENWIKKKLGQQPLDQIRSYFGEKIALYFCYRGFYFSGLTCMASLGLIVFVYGIGDVAITPVNPATVSSSAMNSTITDLATNNDVSSNTTSNASYIENNTERVFMKLFDNALTPWFALITCIWSLLFILFWQRKINFYRFVWNMDGLIHSTPHEELIRHQFKPKGYRQSVITGELDIYFPASYRFTRQVISMFVVIFFWCIATASVICQALFSGWMKSSSDFQTKYETASVIVALMGVGSMWILRIIYAPISQKLNDWENYKTESHFEKALLFKRLSFEFINTFGRLFYFAFWRPVFSQENILGNGAWIDRCVGPCSTDLMYQLLFIIVGDLAVYHVVYSLWPLIRKRLHERRLNLPSFDRISYKSVRPLTDFPSNTSPTYPKSLSTNTASALLMNTSAGISTSTSSPAVNNHDTNQHIAPPSFYPNQMIDHGQNINVSLNGGSPVKMGLLQHNTSAVANFPSHYTDDKLLPPPNHAFFSVTSSGESGTAWGIMDLQIYQILQFGYMTLFIAAFPVGSVLAAISNVLQLRHEAKLYLYVHKRGPPLLPDLNSMKTPFTILRLLATLSITTNAMVIAFTSHFFQKDVLEARFSPEIWWGVRFGFFMLWHFVVFLIVAVIKLMIPVMPSHVKIGRMRQRFVERKVLSSY